MNYLEKKKKAMLNYVSGITPPLPSEYQQVEWIGSSGTQYIDTTYVPNVLTRWECECAFTDIRAWMQLFFGGGGIYNSRAFAIGCYQNTFRVNMADGVATNFEELTADTNKHLFTLDKPNQQATIDTVTKATSGNLNRPKNIYLFAQSNDTIVYVSVNIYSSKIYENDVLIQDLVPCYRKSDNEIGMYDTVTQTFYTNAGTGTFTKGNDV